MSEQSTILVQMQEIIMQILKTGSVSIEEGEKMEELETQLHKQKCFKAIEHSDYDIQGEEIAGLFFDDNYTQAIEKMCECEITPEDFFGFAEYHFEGEEDIDMFTHEFKVGVNEAYQSKCGSK